MKLIRSLQKQVEELKERAQSNKKLLLDYVAENQKLSEPLSKVSAEIAELQTLLKERAKDQMALRNANFRLSELGKSSLTTKQKLQSLEEQYLEVERERDQLYGSFEESIQKVRQQAEFKNQALEQKLVAAEAGVEKAAAQVEEIVRAANLDPAEVARMMSSLNQMLIAKDEVLRDTKFAVIKLQKCFNDSLEVLCAKMKELGIPSEEMQDVGFSLEMLPPGTTSAPAVGLVARCS